MQHQCKFFAYLVAFKSGTAQLKDLLHHYGSRGSLNLLNHTFDPSSVAGTAAINTTCANVRGEIRQARNSLLMGLCCMIADFGLPKWHQMTRGDRNLTYKIFFNRASLECTRALIGHQADKSLFINQVFNDKLMNPAYRERCRPIRLFIESEFCELLEIFYHHVISTGRSIS